MADYLITLTDEQDLALQYDVEQMNAQQIVMAGSGAPVVWTPEQLLVHRVAMQLDNTYRQVKSMVDTVSAMVETVPQDHHETLLGTAPSKAVRDYVRAKLQRGHGPQVTP